MRIRSLLLLIGTGAGPGLAGCERSKAATEQLDPGAPERAGIPLPGDCRGAWWDAATDSLVVADAAHDALLRWRDGAEISAVARLPPAGAFGGVVGLADGRFVIASFGFGKGAVYIAANGETSEVRGLDPARRRTAIALAPDGALYVGYFEVAAGSAPRGGIARLTLTPRGGGETDLAAADLRKPAGVAAARGAVYATDQHRAAVYRIGLGGGGVTTVAGDVPAPELVVALPDGALLVASRAGVVYRVPAAGPAVALARGFDEVRGIAYDPARGRLFVVETRGGPPRSLLHVLQVAR